MSNRYNQSISSFLLLSSMIFAQHYTVDLESTGNSQLTIFSDSITGLEIGDEIGIFDENAITNYNGSLVSELIDKNIQPGYYSLNWDASNNASGVYFVKMMAGDYMQNQKLMLVK